MYAESQSSAFFFIFFIVTSTFYLHSLVLSVVFQTYMQASADIHERSAWYREEATRLAFLALTKNGEKETISVGNVRKSLQVVRPHYSNMKVRYLPCGRVLSTACFLLKSSYAIFGRSKR